MPLPQVSIDSVRLIKFRTFVEPNGTLVPVTAGAEIPFPILRVFYVYGVKAGENRGEHAHIRCQQLLVCLQGSCRVEFDDGQSTGQALLDAPNQGLFIPAGIWARQTYVDNGTVLVAFTDQPFDERDYIRDYDAFLRFRGIRKVAGATR